MSIEPIPPSISILFFPVPVCPSLIDLLLSLIEPIPLSISNVYSLELLFKFNSNLPTPASISLLPSSIELMVVLPTPISKSKLLIVLLLIVI